MEFGSQQRFVDMRQYRDGLPLVIKTALQSLHDF